jgi:hypothetical protein
MSEPFKKQAFIQDVPHARNLVTNHIWDKQSDPTIMIGDWFFILKKWCAGKSFRHNRLFINTNRYFALDS